VLLLGGQGGLVVFLTFIQSEDHQASLEEQGEGTYDDAEDQAVLVGQPQDMRAKHVPREEAQEHKRNEAKPVHNHEAVVDLLLVWRVLVTESFQVVDQGVALLLAVGRVRNVVVLLSRHAVLDSLQIPLVSSKSLLLLLLGLFELLLHEGDVFLEAGFVLLNDGHSLSFFLFNDQG